MPNPESQPSVVSLTGIQLCHAGTTVLRDVNFVLRAGERVALLGPNGAGKTSLLRAMAGIMTPDAGRLLVFDKTYVDGRSGILQRVGYLPESLAVPLAWRVDDFFWAHAQLYGMDAATTQTRLMPIVTMPLWRSIMKRRIETLSKGWRRRIAWAALVLQQPDLWLLDEPTDGFDPIETAEFMTPLTTQLPIASCVISTHDLDLAQRHCPRWVMLHHGTIVYDGVAPTGDAAAFFRNQITKAVA